MEHVTDLENIPLPVYRQHDDTGQWFWDNDPPGLETIDGELVFKVTPKRRHAMLQSRLLVLLAPWGAAHKYDVGSEWRFKLQKGQNEFLADISVVSQARLQTLETDDFEEPPFAPDVAIEIRSPSSRAGRIATKIERNLAFGARLVLDIDPAKRTITAHDAAGVASFVDGDTFEHPALPGFQLDLSAFFDFANRPASG